MTVKDAIKNGEIRIGEDGIARHRDGKAVNRLVISAMIKEGIEFDADGTSKAYNNEFADKLLSLAKKSKVTDSRTELEHEMRATFGKGETVVNIITGETYKT